MFCCDHEGTDAKAKNITDNTGTVGFAVITRFAITRATGLVCCCASVKFTAAGNCLLTNDVTIEPAQSCQISFCSIESKLSANFCSGNLATDVLFNMRNCPCVRLIAVNARWMIEEYYI